MKINIVNYFDSNPDYEPVIRKVLDSASIIHNLSSYTVNIILVDNDYIRELNRRYRSKDYATDVLTFNDDFEQNLGDIFVNIDKVEEQRIKYDHSFDRELGFLVCHGILHTLNYDHQTKEDEILMIEKQNEILNKAELFR